MVTYLEKRTCVRNGCFKHFSVWPSSKQAHCSQDCEEQEVSKDPKHKWQKENQLHFAEQKRRFQSDIPQRLTSVEKNKPENVTGDCMPAAQTSEKSSGLDTKSGTPRTVSPKPVSPPITIETIETGTESSEELKPQKPVKSIERLNNSDLVRSTSMNLIDDSAEHLLALMKGLHANQPASEIKAYDPDRVRAACQCADQIHKMMRLKFDVLRKFGNKK